MAEITAVSNYVQLWFQIGQPGRFKLSFLVLLSCVNLIAVKVFLERLNSGLNDQDCHDFSLDRNRDLYGDDEFETPAEASLTNNTNGFQMFPNGWVKFVMAFQMVFFAYQAIEFVGITTSETANPRQVLPKAIKEIPTEL